MNTNVKKFFERLTRSGFEKAWQKVHDEYDAVCKERDRCRQLVNEWNKDEEIQKAQQQAEFYRRNSLRELSESEAQRIREFREEHYKSCKNSGTYLFELNGTGIGEAITIKCPCCNEEEDVTDYSTW